MEYFIATFRSRTDTMSFFRFLLSNGIGAEIVNTPKEANVGCGLSVKVIKNYYNYLKRALKEFASASFVGIFSVKIANNKKVVRLA